MEIMQKMQKAFQEVFEDETLQINESTSAKDIEKWDSLHHIMILYSLEEAFQIKFDIDEIIKMECVGDMLAIIEKRINK